MAARHLLGVTIATLMLLQTAMACTPIDSCSCKAPDGRVLDLHPLASVNASSPRFFDLPDSQGYLYSWNPCLPFNEGTCAGVAVCQRFTQNPMYYGLGLHNTAQFVESADRSYYSIEYSQTDPQLQQTRTTIIELMCDPSKEASLMVKGENPMLQYNFELHSKYACLQSNTTTTALPVTTSQKPVPASTTPTPKPRTPSPPTPPPAPGPPGLYSLRTVVLLLFGIFFCLLILLALAFIFLFIALIRLSRPSGSSGDGLPGKK